MMEPITIGQAESKVKGMTREEAIREVFESSSNVVSIFFSPPCPFSAVFPSRRAISY